MLKNKTALSLSPLALLTLAACGGTSSSTTSSKGAVQNGPLEGAFAFLDLHIGATFQGDGVYDTATEQGMATTGASDALGAGGYSLTEPASGSYTLIATTNAATVDTDTGTPYGAGITFKAPEGASVITPQTTLIEAIVADSGVAVTAAAITAASTKVATAMGITLPAGETLTTFDPYAAGVTAATKLAVQQANNNVMTVVKAMASAAEGAGVSAAEASKLAFAGMYEFVDDNASAAIDFTNTATMDLVRADVQTEFNTYAATTAGAALNGGAGLDTAEFVTIATAAQVEIEEVATQIKALTTTSTDEEKAAIFKVVSVLADTVETYAKDVTDNGVASAAALAFDTTSQMLNTAPTDIKLSGSTTPDATYSATSAETVAILETAPSLVVGTLTGVDNSVSGTASAPVTADAASALTFAIVGGADSASFELSGAVLSFKSGSEPDYETKTSYSVVISATDASGASKIETFTVSITDDTTESGAFRISSDTVTWTDYDPATDTTITNSFMTSTSGSTVSMGVGSMFMNQTNISNYIDGSAATKGEAPTLSFTLGQIPSGSGTGTVTATVIEGSDATRTGTEDMITLTVKVKYSDGTLSMPAGEATGSFNNGSSATVDFSLDNPSIHAFSLGTTTTSTGTALPTLDVKLGNLFKAFTDGAGSAGVLHAGDYSIAIETTGLPLQNTASEDVTKFTGSLELVTSTPLGQIYGTLGDDTIVGTDASEIIVAGPGTDTITTGAGDDYIYLAEGLGSTDITKINTIAGHDIGVTGTGFMDGKDKFALDDLTFTDDLKVAWDATETGVTVQVESTGEYLIHITDLAKGYITSADFVSVDIL